MRFGYVLCLCICVVLFVNGCVELVLCIELMVVFTRGMCVMCLFMCVFFYVYMCILIVSV